MALRHLCNFIKSKQKTNIVVMTAPPRFDLLSTSCVNSEVMRYNNQLRKRTIQFNNVKLHETNIGRQYFRKHGLHLNSLGKEYIAFRLAALVKSFFHLERLSPIHLKWKGNSVSIDQDRSKNSSVSNSNSGLIPRSHSPEDISVNEDKSNFEPNDSRHNIHYVEKKSNRTKKAPLTRSDDFLWL